LRWFYQTYRLRGLLIAGGVLVALWLLGAPPIWRIERGRPGDGPFDSSSTV